MNKYAQMADRLYDQEQQMKRLEEENAKLKAYNEKLLNGDIEKHNKIVELEKKISNLLSCKNCPENKGGLLCQKEYEGKCLSQKTQYIKELKEEIAELKEKENTVHTLDVLHKEAVRKYAKANTQLSKANGIIKDLLSLGIFGIFKGTTAEEIVERAEKFLKETKEND